VEEIVLDLVVAAGTSVQGQFTGVEDPTGRLRSGGG
jgi:hypothetical protein